MKENPSQSVIKLTINDQKVAIHDSEKPQGNQKGWIKACLLLFGFFFSFSLCGGYISDQITPKILRKYYSLEEIEKNSLKITSTRNEISVSNGDILPQKEHGLFVSELYSRLTPFFLLWGVIISVYLTHCAYPGCFSRIKEFLVKKLLAFGRKTGQEQTRVKPIQIKPKPHRSKKMKKRKRRLTHR